MISNAFLLVFAIAFMGCVLATPFVTKVATWAGAIDRPDQFRRVHKGAVPRMGGLALAFGLVLSLVPVIWGGYLREWDGFATWWPRQWAVLGAALIILVVGAIDDTRGMQAKIKLLGQALAVMVLIAGDIRIKGIALLGVSVPLSYPLAFSALGQHFVLDLPSIAVTLVWFLACMNIWNLIDGMDGLASGVGLLVSGTLMLVAIHQGNMGSAATAAALAGCLAGFLLYNWHPACIFLGDTGSLLIGLLIGVIGVQDSLKGTTAVSILFPILAMGLPITDTAMAIFRRWVRELPLSSADRRHVHHLLMNLGLNPRQSAVILYFFTAGLCGVVLLGVAWRNEFLALVLGLSGCLAFLVILTSRRDELASLWADLQARRLRKRQEQHAAKVTWETIQKIELCENTERIWQTLLDASRSLGSDQVVIQCYHAGRLVLEHSSKSDPQATMAGSVASFRLLGGQDIELSVSLHQATESDLAADIAFRSLQRISLATAQRLERLLTPGPAADAKPVDDSEEEAETPPKPEVVVALNGDAHARGETLGWLRGALGWGTSRLARQTWYGEK
jgi:UDP-GlcNAc:undecaprenyl-phosphate GlcNAc-1-phosphate transferase